VEQRGAWGGLLKKKGVPGEIGRGEVPTRLQNSSKGDGESGPFGRKKEKEVGATALDPDVKEAREKCW